MDLKAIGNQVKSLRTKKRISQQELSKKIGLKQSALSSIEYGTYPLNGVYIKKLNIISEYFKINLSDLLFYSESEYKLLQKKEEKRFLLASSEFSENHNYFEMKRFLIKEKNNPFLDSPLIQKIIIRFRAIIMACVEENLEGAISILETYTTLITEDIDDIYQTILFINCLAGFYLLKNRCSDAKDKYLLAIHIFETYHFDKCDRLYLRLIFNLSLAFRRCNEIELSMKWINQGIRLNKKNLSMYSLNDLYYQKALILLSRKDILGSKKALYSAKFFSNLLGLENSIEYEACLELAIELGEMGVWMYNGKPIYEYDKREIEELFISIKYNSKKKRGRPKKLL